MTQIRVPTPEGPYDLAAALVSEAAAAREYTDAEHTWEAALAAAGHARHADQTHPAPAITPAAPTAPTPTPATRTVEVQPNRWVTPDSGPVTVTDTPVQIWPALPGAGEILVVNTGANDVKLAEEPAKLRRGGGMTVAAGASFRISGRFTGWAYSTAGSSVEVTWTYYSGEPAGPGGDR